VTQEEFYRSISDWISQDKSRWNHITLVAYFCHKYESKNKARFRLVKWNKDPGKGKESRDFAKLFSIFAPEGYKDMSAEDKRRHRFLVNQKMYNYINWMFDYKFRSGEKSVTGTGIFLLPSMVNEFERMYSSQLKKINDDDKMSNLIRWCNENACEIFDLHSLEDTSDLKMISRYLETHSLENDSFEYIVISKAKEFGIL
tara:strand:- start:331 stop:930 length:600 start_codon:yes stop_codon:yes gene_type:complete